MVAQTRHAIRWWWFAGQLRHALARLARWVLPGFPWLLLASLTALVGILVARVVIWPGYVNPNSRMYSSQLGYAALLRQQERPFPVQTCYPEYRTLTQHFVGEGFVRSAPVLVPVIPTARIERIVVQEGEHVQRGQLLLQLDATHARLRLDAARVMLEVARAELERTRIGSAYLLEKERPEQDSIRVEAAEDQVQIGDELNRMSESLFRKGVISRTELLQQRLSLVQMLFNLRQAETALQQSQQGRQQSLRIAEAAVREAELAVAQRELEVSEHEVLAPADGIIERCLVHEGEFNQDPGKPAFLLASGQWFEAYFDQTVAGQVKIGDRSFIHLEAFPGMPLTGRIRSVHPFVAFSVNGPETTQPIRPSGTGAPEWPSTFSVRIELKERSPSIYTGLSGFAKIGHDREAMALPSSAILSATSGEGLVLVRKGDTFQSCQVVLGAHADGWTEVTGLEGSDEVLVEGHHVLRPGDKIQVTNRRSPDASVPRG